MYGNFCFWLCFFISFGIEFYNFLKKNRLNALLQHHLVKIKGKFLENCVRKIRTRLKWVYGLFKEFFRNYNRKKTPSINRICLVIESLHFRLYLKFFTVSIRLGDFSIFDSDYFTNSVVEILLSIITYNIVGILFCEHCECKLGKSFFLFR